MASSTKVVFCQWFQCLSVLRVTPKGLFCLLVTAKDAFITSIESASLSARQTTATLPRHIHRPDRPSAYLNVFVLPGVETFAAVGALKAKTLHVSLFFRHTASQFWHRCAPVRHWPERHSIPFLTWRGLAGVFYTICYSSCKCLGASF